MQVFKYIQYFTYCKQQLEIKLNPILSIKIRDISNELVVIIIQMRKIVIDTST